MDRTIFFRRRSDCWSRAIGRQIEGRINYYGGIWLAGRMAELYQVADAYVTPYACEGFNLPALEAAACGLPLICTRGGPTDEFTTADFLAADRFGPALQRP